METSHLVEELAAGFETLQEEYQKLFGQHQSLERKLATARQQYNELAKLCGAGALTTPPLSLSSAPAATKEDLAEKFDVPANIARGNGGDGGAAACRVRAAVDASHILRSGPRLDAAQGVRIWSGPAADRPEAACSFMPSISESPLEQDFTIEGKPSQLGCPFASMANKKLSSHAASVLSRYNTRDSTGGVPSTPLSSVSRVNGRESLSRRGSRRTSFADPIKAEICGLSDHNEPGSAAVSERVEPRRHVEVVEEAELGVCPIRFMDQHSPEEVATYFEKHKHELPRSHEVCVRRYQSNEEQIRQLDAKYGNLVSMIQGLGAKHKEMLPHEPAEDAGEGEEVEMDKKAEDKVRKWARSVSARAADGLEEVHDSAQEQDRDERLSHFDRPLREIRVGESPSRPWGISVPAKYVEAAPRSEASIGPAPVVSHERAPSAHPPRLEQLSPKGTAEATPAARCPFGFDQQAVPAPAADSAKLARPTSPGRAPEQLVREEQPGFIASPLADDAKHGHEQQQHQPRMVFTGPVFIGYGAEDAARILRESGWAGGSR
ncbi:hypothetical protein LTR53_006504 [Teratosphaeriaceae sp. CCFEE 6253]|nr:hypothetical protein LTR53_006504 [Teratosphaeriaceae sp. CCFEE 6253]